ncbi:MAG: shikimate dehydrogenase [Actinobacteria bacterium]|nr:shikimate dehydrogenase [Actinomycetota bacterium]
MKCAVLGSPVAHSKSPQLHLAGYAFLGLDWSYERHELAKNALSSFVSKLDNTWAGLSLTMPLKEEALDLADDVDPLARRVGGANTLVREGERWRAFNTDVLGFTQIFKKQTRLGSVSILGGGATARAALAALEPFDVQVSVYLRSAHRIASIEKAFGEGSGRLIIKDWKERADSLVDSFLISTTPDGASDDLAEVSDASSVARPEIFVDALYGNWPTPLARALSGRGCEVLSGKTLLVYQAVEQIRLMTHLDFDQQRMESLLFGAVEK